MRRLVSPILLAALVACASTPSGSLGGDPLVDIGEVRRVEAVILDGELYPRARLAS